MARVMREKYADIDFDMFWLREKLNNRIVKPKMRMVWMQY